VDVDLTLARLKTYFQLAGLVFILWDLYATPAALKAGLQAYILGAYVSIGSTIANYLAANEFFPDRYTATGFHVNELGLIVALGIPVAWHLAVSEDYGKTNQVLRLANYAYIPAAVLAILLTASRGSLLAALPACLYVLGSLTRLKLFQRILIPAMLIGALYALQPLVPQASLQRLATIGPSIAESDFGGRIDIWRKGIDVFSEHPFLGIGSGAFPTAIESDLVAHNTFLSVLVEVGMIGFVLFACILAIAVHQAVHQPKWDARFWLTVLLVWALGGSVSSSEHTKQTWLFLNFVVVSASLTPRAVRPGLQSKPPATLVNRTN
jgi:O-antigen ligase